MNPIALRIAEFLQEYPPFSKLSVNDLSEIATAIRVVNLEKHKILFQINDELHDSFYVVASGVINLLVVSDAEETLLNKCLPGDMFGLRPFFAKNNYQMTAKAREESVVFAIPIAAFRSFVSSNAEVLNFLLESFATNTLNPEDNRSNMLSDSLLYSGQRSEIQYFQSLSYNKAPLKAVPATTVREAAQMMTDNLADSLIVVNKNLPAGIVTDMDLRTKIATGRFPVTATIDKIMSTPVITVGENVSLAEAQLLLLKYNISHLCVTQDGSEQTEIRGVVSQRDLIVAQASNPGVLIKEIKKSQNAKDLKSIRTKLTELIRTSISKNIPLTHIYNIAGEINLALIRRSIELAILDLGSPPARFAWLSIGSQGRKEQLLLTDQDHIIAFEDVSADKYRDVKDYFLRLAKKASITLRDIGYPLCPNGHMANNMHWCKSVTEWVKQYQLWMNTPNNDLSGIFFDYEIAFGEGRIEETITEAIFSNVRRNSSLFDFLGNAALRNNSPLTFFRKFNVEEDGEHRDKFDIKSKALLPLIDGARMMVLAQDIRGINNTYLRFKQLAMADAKNSEIYLNCADAFLTLAKIRTQEGLKNDGNGQYINLEEMPKADREKLKAAFLPMKDLEDLIKDRFRLTQFS